ncbi:iron-sulfur cluster assembly scaffold protein [Candidatus Gracilibacteria bacterium 28_42_T64]|nr:iron-sulfur cluster assembly scaffold protein [Candidatus Gracilibacteria bacterium 28_42_T64]
MYNETITFYSKTPPNKGELTNYSVKYYEDNSICGDDLDVYLKIEDNRIIDFSFMGDTAIITTACASIFGESIIDVGLNDVLRMDYNTIEELIGMPVSPRRKQASVLGLLTTRNAIHDYLQDGIKDDFDDVM